MESKPIYETSTQDETVDALTGNLDITAEELMDAIAATLQPRRPQCGFTKRQFRERHGITHYRADKLLSAEVLAGRLVCHLYPRADGTGGQELVYFPPPDK